jgi:hypothetical protein
METLLAIALYEYNVGTMERAMDLFPKSHPTYQLEWSERFQKGWAYAIGKMDTETRQRYLDKALEDWGEAARLTLRAGG